jgi:hypothetical protein
MFQIEQDEDNKELSFHLKNYDEEEDDNEETDTKVNSEEQTKETKKDKNAPIVTDEHTKDKSKEDVSKVKEENESIIKEEKETDSNTVVHILLLKGTNVDLEGLPFVKFSKLKKENKLISFFKVR